MGIPTRIPIGLRIPWECLREFLRDFLYRSYGHPCEFLEIAMGTPTRIPMNISFRTLTGIPMHMSMGINVGCLLANWKELEWEMPWETQCGSVWEF